ncbi:MAG: metallophosphoesterase [Actinobacteria bacterium]|nr:metallophosphoesterase [Actinomycetota bacterium]
MRYRLLCLFTFVAFALVLAFAAAEAQSAPKRSDPVIAAAGDIACASATATSTTCRQKYTSDLLVTAGLARVLTLGDNQYESGSLSAFNSYFGPTWGRVKSLIRPTVGNHEYGTPSASGYFDYFGAVAGSRGKGYYSYDVGAWHLVALNSNCSIVSCAAGSAQESWLRADLSAHPTKCVLAYWHHPRFSSGKHGNNNTVGAFWIDLYNANADVVLAGHDHDYERFAPQNAGGVSDPLRGLREFVVGTGGKSHRGFPSVKANSVVRNSSTFGVLELTLHATSYDWKFVPEAGGSFKDSGSASCH